ncbi:MAG: tetratricopeptide repeat protein [Bacteroidia bacterium]|nr:tetratricopeptide repeat protein [Bacteroidia bacterium]
MLRSFLFYFLPVFFNSFFFVAKNLPDSLELKIRKAATEQVRVLAYEEAAIFLTNFDDIKLVLTYSDSGLALARKQLLVQKDEKIKKELQFNISSFQGIRGTCMQMINKLGPAVQAYLEAIQIQEKYKVKNTLIANLNNVGILYYANKDYEKSLEYYKKAIDENKNGEFKQWLAATYHGMASVFMDLKKYEEAEAYVNKAVVINKETENEDWLANNYSILAELRRIQKRNEERFVYLKEIEKIREQHGDPYSRLTDLLTIAKYYFETDNSAEGFKNLEKGLKLATESEIYEFVGGFSKELMDHYSRKGNNDKAFYFARIYMRASDTLAAYKNKEEVYRSEINFEYENKRTKDSLEIMEERMLNDLKLKNKNQEIEHEKNIKTVIYISLSLVCVLLVFTFRSYLQKNKANKQNLEQKIIIEEKADQLEARQKEILDSIYYARRIQNALMANENHIERKLRQLKKNT